MITGTVSIVEVVWTGLALIGLVFNTRVLIGATLDFLSLKMRRINSLREYASITTVLAYGSWFFVQLVLVLLGINAMTTPNPDSARLPVVQQYISASLAITVTVVLAFTSYMVDRRRKTLRAKIIQIEDGTD